MKKEQLQKILKDISTVKIAVVGDFCLDAYWFIDEAMSEISVETNQATRPVATTAIFPGWSWKCNKQPCCHGDQGYPCIWCDRNRSFRG